MHVMGIVLGTELTTSTREHTIKKAVIFLTAALCGALLASKMIDSYRPVRENLTLIFFQF